MSNPLNLIARQSGYTRAQLAELTGLDHKTLDRILSPTRKPCCNTTTIDRLTAPLGYEWGFELRKVAK